MNFAGLFQKAQVIAADAEYVVTRAQFYMHLAEDSTLTGSQKLDAVKNALESDLKTAKPELVGTFDTIWTDVVPLISGMVTLFRLTGVFATVAKAL
jgi:hypothetical protein